MTIRHTTEIEGTWDQIKAAAMAGTVRELIHSGDSIPIRLKTGEDVVLDATYDENGKLYFVFHDCLKEQRRMNKTDTNKGGWAASELREKANTEIFDTLPDELQEIIVPTKIVQVIGGERIECEDKLFCLSYTQIAGKTWPEVNAQEPEDTQLDIFTGERSRVKECGDNGTWFWWERSPGVGNSYYFCIVYASGYPNGSDYYGGAYGAGGVCLGFCINP